MTIGPSLAPELPGGVPSARQCATRALIERAASTHPQRLFARFAHGSEDWTYAELQRQVARAANALRRIGVVQHEKVLCWLPNGAAAIRTWLALNCLGAVYVPMNPALRGAMLRHAINISGARRIVVHSTLAPLLAPDVRGSLEQAYVVGEASGQAQREPGFFRPGDALDDPDECWPVLHNEIAPWDAPAIIFTSGTTGPSKAVVTSYAHLWATAVHSPVAGHPEQRYLQYLPLFHVSGITPVYQALLHGASIAVIERFRTANFWSDVLRTGATDASVMGTIASFLLALPRTEAEQRTPLRRLMVSPLTEETMALALRINAQYFTWFNMTEVSRPLISGLGPTKPGMCGRPRAGVQARIVDAHDIDVAAGAVGELVLRTDAPWAMNSGYLGNPDATAAAWRNGWFHTGDAFRVDEDGDYFFVDRIKDAIRRRGENISSFEVEREVLAFPGVKDCAAIGVPSTQSDEEVLIAVEAAEGVQIDPAALLDFLAPRMPRYMLPRYVRIMTSMPRTPTFRVRKDLLRTEGLEAAWDREASSERQDA